MSLGSTGLGNQAETEITYVDPGAVSGFGGDYDYEDYYDYEDEEVVESTNEVVQEARDDDEGEEEEVGEQLKADNKQEEIYVPDRKVSTIIFHFFIAARIIKHSIFSRGA